MLDTLYIRDYIQNLSKTKQKQKKCKERTQPKTKKKSQMGAYYTLIIVWLDKKLLYHNQLKV